MRQLAGTKAMYRRAHAAPLAGVIYGRAEYKSIIWMRMVGAQGSSDLAVFSEPPHQRTCLTMSYEDLFRLSFVNSL